jgi:uncharacterized protein YneF (UPF0154 family)
MMNRKQRKRAMLLLAATICLGWFGGVFLGFFLSRHF